MSKKYTLVMKSGNREVGVKICKVMESSIKFHWTVLVNENIEDGQELSEKDNKILEDFGYWYDPRTPNHLYHLYNSDDAWNDREHLCKDNHLVINKRDGSVGINGMDYFSFNVTFNKDYIDKSRPSIHVKMDKEFHSIEEFKKWFDEFKDHLK